MTSKREQILSALHTKISAITSIGSQNVFRSRQIALSREELPACLIEPVQDVANNSMIPFIDWTLLVKITLIVRGGIMDQVADPMINAIHAAIMDDQSLGGLTMDAQTQAHNFDFYDNDNGMAVIALTYNFIYRTSNNNLTT